MTIWTYVVVGMLWAGAAVVGYLTVRARRP